jgi:hypothetical protein
MDPKPKPTEEQKQEAKDALKKIADGCEAYDLEQFQKALDVWNAVNREIRTHDKKAEDK